jgi:hypothetical protein
MDLGRYMRRAVCLFAFTTCASIANECAPFHCSFDDADAIAQSGGTVSGTLTFPLGINGTAANFGGATSVRFMTTLFDTPNGSVSLWFKKGLSDQKGGILEVGHLGTPNSIGLFYANSNNVYFEMRNSANQHTVAYAENVLSQAAYNHIVAMWDMRADVYHMKLFINGRYLGGSTLSAPYAHSHGSMDVGVAGVGEWYGNGRGMIDELRFFDWALSDGEVYAEYVYSSNRHRNQPTNKPISTGPVKLTSKSLTVNDKPFTIKGVGYQPVPIGMSPDRATLEGIFTDPEIIQRDVAYLNRMNVNTIRLWAQLPNTTLLDALEAAGIYAIMAFQVPSTVDIPGIDYSDPATIAFYTNGIADYVNQFKDHPAVLAWAIGNENNLHYKKDVSDWYKLANKLAQAAYEAEKPAYHPTILVNGYMLFFGDIDYSSDDASLDYVDVWGHNNYIRYYYHSYFCYYDRISAKPLVMTEFGVDAYGPGLPWENQHVQAEWVVHEWAQVKDNCLGGTIMAYCDEWWKCGSPSTHDLCGYYTDVQPDIFSNEEWYGVMAVEKNGSSVDIMHPRQVYCALQQTFSDCKIASDFNTDNHVDFGDFTTFASNWMNMGCFEKDCCSGTDVDHDGAVGITDLAILSEQWLQDNIL